MQGAGGTLLEQGPATQGEGLRWEYTTHVTGALSKTINANFANGANALSGTRSANLYGFIRPFAVFAFKILEKIFDFENAIFILMCNLALASIRSSLIIKASFIAKLRFPFEQFNGGEHGFALNIFPKPSNIFVIGQGGNII